MSLEAALAENTATMKQLIAVLQSGALGVDAAGTTAADAGAKAADNTAVKRNKKAETPAPTPAPTTAPALSTGMRMALGVANDGKLTSLNLQAGDPEGTLYFHVPQHRTVAAVRPTEIVPNMAGILEIDGNAYASLKAQYAAPVPSSQAAATSGAAATPATSPAASTASSSAPATSPQAASAPIDGPALLEKCKALHGHLGNDALAAVLKKYVTEANGFAKDVVVNVPALIGKASLHATAAADIDKLLTLTKGSGVDAINAALAPAAAESANPLFG